MSSNGESTPASQPNSSAPPDAASPKDDAVGNVINPPVRVGPSEPSAPVIDDEDDGDNIGNTLSPLGSPRTAASAAPAAFVAPPDEDDDAQPARDPQPGTPVQEAGGANPPTEQGTQGAGRKRHRNRHKGPRAEGQNPQGQNPQGQNPQGQNPQGQNPQGQNPQGQNSSRGNQRAEAQQHRAFHAGDKVRARIIAVGPGGVLVDLWGKEQGVLDLRELVNVDAPNPGIGDTVDVIVLQDGARGGNLVVTRDPTRAERSREMVAHSFNAGEPVEGLITGHNRGGLEVDIGGVRAFCPSSHIDIRIPNNQELAAMLLRRELFKITSLLEGGREAVVSRRALREQDVRERAEQAIGRFNVGDRVTGRVVSVREHGIFVDLGGVEGRIQLAEISHDRGARPSDVAKVGDEIEAVVLRIDIPQPAPAPMATGTATDPGAARGEAPTEAEALSEEAQAEGAQPETEGAQPHAEPASAENGAPREGREGRENRGRERRFSRLPEGTPRVELSRRALEKDPWSDVHKRYPIGSVIKGKVARMQPFGAFIELEKGVDGLLHVSEIGDKRIQHPNEVLKDQQEVTVRVARIDRGQHRIALTLIPEGMTDEQVRQTISPKMGLIAQAKILEHDSFGVWAQIEGTLGKAGRGLILPQDTNQPKGTDLRRALPPGTEVKVKVTAIERGRVNLSIRAALQDEERQAYRAYQQQANATTVGVSLADKLRKLNLSR